MQQNHTIGNFFDKNSKILILGSFPSVKSREQGFFYGHKQNRFWKVVSAVLELPTPQNIDEKKKFLLSNNIALWDVIATCDIKGSADSSIKDVIPNDINKITNFCNINMIFTNGKTAYKLYSKYIFQKNNFKAVCLPSTSPANARYSLQKLTEEWKIIKTFLK
ncbi:MAG: DNA-deoxyinosine glycosylase [Clostridia bacterium]|nr:DNA-deoxyinosine glycosylase [Clostridia bacterium]